MTRSDRTSAIKNNAGKEKRKISSKADLTPIVGLHQASETINIQKKKQKVL